MRILADQQSVHAAQRRLESKLVELFLMGSSIHFCRCADRYVRVFNFCLSQNDHRRGHLVGSEIIFLHGDAFALGRGSQDQHAESHQHGAADA